MNERAVIDGASFILDAPKDIPAVWGSGGRVAWSAGEALLIVGPSGIGKTTLVQQLVLRLGLRARAHIAWPSGRRGAAPRALHRRRPPSSGCSAASVACATRKIARGCGSSLCVAGAAAVRPSRQRLKG